MAPQNCWRCLLRPTLGTSTSSTRTLVAPTTTTTTMVATTILSPSNTQPFSTTAAQHAVNPSKAGAGKHIRLGKRMTMTKFKNKNPIVHGKRPGHGERKAWRKRIVLSNNNAVPVENLDLMTANNLADPATAGKVLKIPTDTIDKLRRVEAFKATQTWHLFHSPHSLVRRETVDLCTRMGRAVREKKTAQIVVAGERGTGKSTVLLQSMVHALLNDWIVIHLPEAQELTTAMTEYAAIPDTEPQIWMQSVYALALLHKIRDVNRHVLANLYTTRSYEEFTNPVVAGATLVTLIDSAREAEQAWPVFTALWYELFTVAADGAGPRPPIFFSLDGLGWAMRMSDYRNQQFQPIHSHDLAIVRMFVDLLSGATSLPNGGAIVAATSRSNAPRNASLEIAIARQLARQTEGAEVPPRDPYCRTYDERVDAAMDGTGIEVVDVQAITKAEARSLLEYWGASGLLRARVDEKVVSEKWMTGGNGVIAEMERAGLLSLRL